MLKYRYQTSFEAASQAPTLTSSSSTSITDMEKDVEITSSFVKCNSNEASCSSLSSPTRPTSEVAVDAEKVANLTIQVTAMSHDKNLLRDTQTSEDGNEYPTGLKLGLITLALCLSVFLMALDNAIIATAIPKISNSFHSLSDVGWYGSAYMLTGAALQLLFGKFYTFLSIKSVSLTAICIFELGSLICGAAQTSVMLIIGRAVAGLGSAGIMSGSLLILAHSVPLARRPMYSGLIQSMYGIASVAGPLLGGVFADKVSWRWCFFINLPLGFITVLTIVVCFPDPKRLKPEKETLWGRINRFDPVGTFLFMPAVISLLLALQWGGTKYAWNDVRIIALLVVFGVLILGFIYMQQHQQENATIPPRILKNRTVWASSLFAFGVGSCFFLVVCYIPIWFQAVQGVSAVDSGIRNLPMLISVVAFTMLAGGLVTTWGHYAPFMIGGTIVMSIGTGLLFAFKPDTPTSAWIGYQFLFGAGVGMALQQPLMAVQTVLDIKDVPTGTSVIVFLQTLGGALFVSVAQSVFTNQLVESMAIYVPSLDPKIVLVTGATTLQHTVPADSLPGVITAYSEALTKAFLVAAGLAAFTIVGSISIPWESVKGKKAEIVSV